MSAIMSTSSQETSDQQQQQPSSTTYVIYAGAESFTFDKNAIDLDLPRFKNSFNKINNATNTVCVDLPKNVGFKIDDLLFVLTYVAEKEILPLSSNTMKCCIPGIVAIFEKYAKESTLCYYVCIIKLIQDIQYSAHKIMQSNNLRDNLVLRTQQMTRNMDILVSNHNNVKINNNDSRLVTNIKFLLKVLGLLACVVDSDMSYLDMLSAEEEELYKYMILDGFLAVESFTVTNEDNQSTCRVSTTWGARSNAIFGSESEFKKNYMYPVSILRYVVAGNRAATQWLQQHCGYDGRRAFAQEMTYERRHENKQQ